MLIGVGIGIIIATAMMSIAQSSMSRSTIESKARALGMDYYSESKVLK